MLAPEFTLTEVANLLWRLQRVGQLPAGCDRGKPEGERLAAAGDPAADGPDGPQL